jgi:IPT/TIG domain
MGQVVVVQVKPPAGAPPHPLSCQVRVSGGSLSSPIDELADTTGKATLPAAAASKEVTFQQRKLTASAEVVTEDGQPAGAGAKLVLVDSTGADRQIVDTAADGKATFNPPAIGLHRIDLRSPPSGFSAPYELTYSVTVAEQAGEPVKFVVVPSKKKPAKVGSWASIVSIVVLAVIGLLLLWRQLPAPSGSVAAAMATWVVTAFLLVLTLINTQRGFFEPVVGADNRTSTSRVAPAIWTLTLAWAISFLLLEAGTDQERVKAAFPADRWDDYLVLLGGPFAAFVIAKGVTSWKIQNGQVQKTNNDGNPTPAQVFKNDDGTTSLVDAQYLAFNLVALVYFWAVVFQRVGKAGSKAWALPSIPLQLLVLTGSAALTYAANKAILNNKPTITAIEPSSVRPGKTVRIQGLNFRPDGVSASDLASVTIEGVGAPPVKMPQSDTTLEITVPPGAPAGFHNVVVTSAAKVTTEPRTLQILNEQEDS